MKKICFECQEEIKGECYADLLDGRYYFCTTCSEHEYVEVMDEIDAERRALKRDMAYLKRMAKDAITMPDIDYARGMIERSIAWIELTPKERIDKCVSKT